MKKGDLITGAVIFFAGIALKLVSIFTGSRFVIRGTNLEAFWILLAIGVLIFAAFPFFRKKSKD
ncbi:hypothetical protein JW890_02270 [candidate division WOR-3 bacterium]|nr:hypothetical protein [candidate division WOR-3 bacterium]